eukprot:1153266-Prorocentrum_minimum.AAC.1
MALRVATGISSRPSSDWFPPRGYPPVPPLIGSHPRGGVFDAGGKCREFRVLLVSWVGQIDLSAP